MKQPDLPAVRYTVEYCPSWGSLWRDMNVRYHTHEAALSVASGLIGAGQAVAYKIVQTIETVVTAWCAPEEGQ